MIRLWRPFAIMLVVVTSAPAQTPVGAESEVVTLQPGDVINVLIWREPDLSGSFLVDGNGVVTVPLLGEKRVTDVPLDQLSRVLAEDYRVHLRNPSITITPLRKVLVMGAIRSPGPYEVNPIETVIGVIAQAGGVESQGNPDRVSVVRDGQVLHERVALESTISSLGLRSGDQILIGERSWLVRNQSLVISILLALPSAIFTITRIRG
jgi:protein involved in polysaccharide export with SLBB domain